MMPDYAAVPPLWEADTGELADVDLPEALLRRLEWWVEEWERLMSLPGSERYPDHWRARGKVFLDQVREALGPSYTVKSRGWL